MAIPCAHCGHTLPWRRVVIQRLDGGLRCDDCGQYSFIDDAEARSRRPVWAMVVMVLPIMIVLRLAFRGDVSPLAVIAVLVLGIPALGAMDAYFMRDAATVKQLRESVLRSRFLVVVTSFAFCGLIIALAAARALDIPTGPIAYPGILIGGLFFASLFYAAWARRDTSHTDSEN